jgi:hypothetical protein
MTSKFYDNEDLQFNLLLSIKSIALEKKRGNLQIEAFPIYILNRLFYSILPYGFF